MMASIRKVIQSIPSTRLTLLMLLGTCIFYSGCNSRTSHKQSSYPHVAYTVSPPLWKAGDTLIVEMQVEPEYPGAVPDKAQLYVSGENVHLDVELGQGSTRFVWPTDSLSFTVNNQNTVWMTGLFKFPIHDITFGIEERFQVTRNTKGYFQLEKDEEFYILKKCPCGREKGYISPQRENANSFIRQVLNAE